MNLFSRISTRIQESLEVFLNSFFPEELFIIILLNESCSSILNFMEVFRDNLHWSKELKLIFNLNKVIAGSGINTRHLNGNRNKITNNFLDDIFNTILSFIAYDWGIEYNFTILKVYFDVKHWRMTVMFIINNWDLIGHVSHWRINSFSNSFNNKSIYIIHIG